MGLEGETLGKVSFLSSEDSANSISTVQVKDCHKMKKSHEAKPVWIVADTEDNSPEAIKEVEPGQPAFHKRVTQICARASNGKRFYNKGDVAEFLSWLQKFPHCQVWFHNLQYDIGNLFGDNLDDLDFVLVGGRLIRVRWRNVEFLDSFNIWPMALKKLGKAFGIDKGKLDVNSREYVETDVDILFAAIGFLYRLAAEFELDKVPSTLGGLCIKIWHSLGGSNFECTEEIAHDAFYGGRVELFDKGGSGNFLYTDINSLYPWAMTNPFPSGFEHYGSKLPKFGCARAVVEITDCKVAPLPLRTEEKEILYPVGKFRGTWTVPELQNLENAGGRILQIDEAWGSDKGEFFYRDFVETTYSRRLDAQAKGDDALSLFYKLTMNNLYGRLAMGGEIGRTLLLKETDAAGGPRGIVFGRKQLAQVEIPLPETTNYIHAAYVTSLARVRLFEYLRKIPKNDLCYCDTDSVIFWSESDSPPFPIAKELGEMKLEGKASKVEIVIPKGYKFGEFAKAKGVKQQFAELALRGETVEYDAPFRMREAVTFYDRANSHKLSVWRRVSKTLKLAYEKKREHPTTGQFDPPIFDLHKGENFRIA